MIKLRRRAKLNRNYIPPLQPDLGICFNVRGGGVNPFIRAVFELFVLSEWEIEIVLSRGVNNRFCNTALDAISQGQAKQYIYPRHPELDSGSIQDDFLLISINRFRVKHGMTKKGALDTASQEHAKLESSLSQGKGFNPYPSPLTGEGERSSDEGDIKTSSKRCACYGLSNLFKHNGRLKSTLHDYEQFSILKPLTRPSGTLSRKGRGIDISHFNTSKKGGGKKCLA